MTATEPSTAGQVWRPLLVAISATTGIFKPPIGVALTSGSGVPDGKSALSYRATGSTRDRWYTAPVSSVAMATIAPSVNNLRAIPFVVERTTTIDQLAINVTTAGASSHYRLGIYSDDGNLYPASLVAEAATADTSTTGVKAVALPAPVVLAPGLYWLVSLGDGTAPTIRAIASTAFIPILGFDNTLGTAPGVIWQVALTYGPLPSTFTAGGTVQTSGAPAIFARASA